MRVEPDEYRPLEYGPQQADRLFAYSEPMRQYEVLHISPAGLVDPIRLRQVTDRWIAGHQRKELDDIVQVAADDDASDGLKSEILMARCRLTSALRRLAEAELASGDRRAATQDLIRGIQLSRVFRYSDLVSAQQGTHDETVILRKMRTFNLSVSAAQASLIRGEGPEQGSRKVANLLTRSAALKVRDDARQDRTAVLNLGELRQITRFIERNVPDPASIAYVRKQTRRAVPEVPGIVLMARVAWQNTHSMEQERGLVTALSGPGLPEKSL